MDPIFSFSQVDICHTQLSLNSHLERMEADASTETGMILVTQGLVETMCCHRARGSRT
ncbi:unnamed protein product [Penicillium roqueforti FM164]|uniref:Uncharacterized protein n=1 Tax=Penicillium roqueforti (strain FM164) TaxID=1365484 RepID=W6R4M6_PENRF|nr:unnamed protein product [Penicillium roqueforti FM164]